MSARSRRPGQPLAMLALLVSAWTVTRAIAWEPPFSGWLRDGAEMSLLARERTAAVAPPASAPESTRHPMIRLAAGEPPPSGVRPLDAPQGALVRIPSLIPASLTVAAIPLAGHAGAKVVPQPGDARQRPAAPPTTVSRRFSRWSGDGWLLLRPASLGTPAAGPLVGRYGASQSGAVLRYRLGSDPRRAAIYGRVGAALNSPWERELAFGLAARPVARLPVAAQAEMRLTRNAGRTSLGPAVMAVSQIDPVILPLDTRADIYLAGGYVGGAADTPFVGGHLRLEREVGQVGGARLRAGGGVWGGAQEGAAALDVGPAAAVELELGELRTRLQLDYRLRVAGDAAPHSGPALTLSTGF